VADTLGNPATYNWSFELEKQVVLVNGLFTFGSPSAQRAGQRVPPIPTRLLADRAGSGGPVRMIDSEWTLETVNADSLVIAYTGTSAPIYSIDQYLTNMTPATVNEIFYRKVTSIQDNAVAKKLTLGTVDVPAWEIVTEASASLSEDDIAFEADADGRIVRAYQMKSLSGSDKFSLAPLQIDWSGKEVMGLYERSNGSTGAIFGLPIADRPPQYDEEWDCKLKLKQGILRLRPTLSISAETRFLSLKKLHSECTVEVDTVLEPEFEFIVPSIDYDFDLDNAVNKEPLIKWNFIIPMGASGLWVDVSPRLRAEATITAGLTGTVSTGAAGGFSNTMVIDYDKDRDPRLNIEAKDGDASFNLIEPQIALGGTAGVEFKLMPEIDVKLNSLAGFYLNFDPALGSDINANFNSSTLVGADIGVTFNGHVNVGMSVLGVSNSLLPSFEPWEVFDKDWRWYFPESLASDPLQILVQPVSQTIPPGGNLQLGVQANRNTAVTYEWRHNGRRLFVDLPTLKLYGVTTAAAGEYKVILRYGAEVVESAVASVTVAVPPQPANEFALIPAGPFTMGRTSGDTDSNAPPVTVNVSAFYMGKYEVTRGLWDEVRIWGAANGYTDLRAGGSYAKANHPVHSITWYEMVKWCNARSQKENLTPCYTVSGATYKTGSSDAVTCNWGANGYRLPTEAEWEKAARGGVSGKRYPWGTDTISHSQANYYASGTSFGNLSGNVGYHPTYVADSTTYSSPVGSFAANGFRLYDMAGNAAERCWDWYGASTYVNGATDPRGAASGAQRVFRGGSSVGGAGYSRAAFRVSLPPTEFYNVIGFRIARSSVP
jgi:formylglycine-generating enzyme